MKKLLSLFTFIVIAFGTATAQIPQFYFTVGSGGTSTISYPFNTSTTSPRTGSHLQSIYYASNFGTPLGGYISTVYVRAGTTRSTSTMVSNLVIAMHTTNLSTYTSGVYQKGLDTALNAAIYTVPSTVMGTWLPITLQKPFYYDGVHNLMIDIISDSLISSTGFSIYQDPNTSTLANRRIAYIYPAKDTGNVSFGLCDFGFDVATYGTNNAGLNFAQPSNFCPGNKDVVVKLINNGSNVINNVQVNWQLDGVTQTPVNYTTPLNILRSSGGNTVLVTLGNVNFNNAPHTIKAWTSLPNSVADVINGDDTINVTVKSTLSGTYTIGGTAPNYPTVTAAVADLNSYGICGPVVFNIRSGTYVGRVKLNNIGGVNTVNTITFRSETHNPNDVVILDSTGNPSADYVFFNNNTSYITLKQLTIQAYSGSAYVPNGTVVDMEGAVSYNKIDSCRLLSPVINTVWSGPDNVVLLSNVLTGGKNIITNNFMEGGSYGIYISGTSISTLTDSNVFENNTIQKASGTSVTLQYTSNTKFRYNTIPTISTYRDYYGIHAMNNYGTLEIIGNRLGGQQNGHGIDLENNSGSMLQQQKIYNNTVTTISGAIAIYGIFSQGNSYQSIYNNSVYMSSTAATSYAGYINLSTGNTGNIVRNNIFANGGGGAAYYWVTNGGNNTSDYNDFATTGQVLVQAGVASPKYAKLADWWAAGGQDRNSINYMPVFLDYTYLTPDATAPAAWALNGRGTQISDNDKDLNLTARSTALTDGVPDLGAYEFTPTSVPPAAIALPAAPVANGTQIFLFGEDTVATIKWGATVPAQATLLQYSGKVPPVMGSTNHYMYFYTDFSVSAGSYTYDAAIYYKDPWLGIVPAENNLLLAKKIGVGSWATISGSNVNTNLNILAKTGLTDIAALFTGSDFISSTACTGTPNAPIITNGSMQTICTGNSILLQAVDPNVLGGTAGITYQWEQASNAAGPWTDVAGATDTMLNTGAITTTTWYRIRAICAASSQSAESAAIQIVPATPHPQIIVNGNALSVNGTYASYQWYLNGRLINNATQATYATTQNGNYTVQVTDSTGCTGMSSGTTGIPGATSNINISIYPNPADNVIYIAAATTVNAAVYSMDGKLLLQKADTKTMDVSGLANGVYMIRISDNATLLQVQKIIISRK